MPQDVPLGSILRFDVSGGTAPGYDAWSFGGTLDDTRRVEQSGASQASRSFSLAGTFFDRAPRVVAADRQVRFRLPDTSAPLAQLEAGTGMQATLHGSYSFAELHQAGSSTYAYVSVSADRKSMTGTLPYVSGQMELIVSTGYPEPHPPLAAVTFIHTNVTLDDSTAPAPPTGVTVVAADAEVLVAWTAPDDGGSAITSYTVTSSPAGGTCSTTATSCTVGGLTNGTLYAFTVTATNAVGSSSSYQSVGVTPLPAGPPGSRFVPLSPVRLLDTRNGTGVPAGPITAGGVTSLQVTGIAGVPVSGVTAVALNVTAVFPSRSTFITAYPTGHPRPLASNLNPVAGSIVPNLVIVKVGDLGRINLYNETGSTDLLADIAGYYTNDTSGSKYRPLTPSRVLDTRTGTGRPGGGGAGRRVGPDRPPDHRRRGHPDHRRHGRRAQRDGRAADPGHLRDGRPPRGMARRA